MDTMPKLSELCLDRANYAILCSAMLCYAMLHSLTLYEDCLSWFPPCWPPLGHRPGRR